MTKTQSDDPDAAVAAGKALRIVNQILADLPQAETLHYGGHEIRLNKHEMCASCTVPIAEAQAAELALRDCAAEVRDEAVKGYVALAADLLKAEAKAAHIRAQFHAGQSSESILNHLLGYLYERHVGETYEHSHHQGRVS